MDNRRSIDPMLVEIKTKLIDHVDRYERDWNETKVWRDDVNVRLRVHCDFIKDVSPIYKTLCKVLGVIALASIGIAAAAFWTHVRWN